jgi:hypothetical protein
MAPPQQPPPQPDSQLALAVTAVLTTAVTVDAAVSVLSVSFRRAGVEPAALRGSLTAVMSFPPENLGAHGPATMAVIRLNHLRRAQFVVAAARRLTADLRLARSRGESLGRALADGVSRETRYYGQHLQATWNRAKAASATDSAASLYGDVLGWNATMDKVTSPECRAANGKNFWAASMPLIGYPGMVHPACRCWPSRAHAGAAFLPTAAKRMVRAA